MIKILQQCCIKSKPNEYIDGTGVGVTGATFSGLPGGG